ncbi:hypothetical protein, variant 2 [Aphanomyces invadans]|uniref:PDZ domain-containing protein n=1 Tax=Aphanomyces invadans TaxID=157072 RepID=A0A024UEH1_9STRA|nr:hypothetical protein, variant 2 [Aphanomyces invadans]ETW04013.1 hypothetical protein, variant 2 [Aphanomyces invadans]|eukprot:XP_008866969.1 hypothetical protein, variant 2 [Aphanomyces invadans]
MDKEVPELDHDDRIDQFSTAKSHDDEIDGPGGDDDSVTPQATSDLDVKELSIRVTHTRADRLEEMQSVVKRVVYESRGPLYLDLCSRTFPHLGALVKSFRTTADGGKGQAELSGNVHIGDLVLSLNDVDCTVLPFQHVVLEAKNANFPLVLTVLPKVYVPEFFPIAPPSVPGRRGSEHTLSTDPSQPCTPTNGSVGRWGKFGQILDMRPKRASLTAVDITKATILTSPRVHAVTTNSTSTSSSPPSPATTTTVGTLSTTSVGWTATPPAPQHQQQQPGGRTPPGTVTTNNEKFQQKFKNWQDSITLDKVVTSSTNLLKFMGGKKTPDEKDEWTQWLHGASIAFREHTNAFHTSGLHLVSTGKAMGVEDGEVHCQWFRILPATNEWLLLQGATHRTYMPSIDDVGATIGLSCCISRLGSMSPVKLVQLDQPLVVDPSVQDTTRMMVEAGSASFSATLANSELVSFQLKVDTNHVVVIQITEDDFDTVVDAPYDDQLHVYLDPEDSTRFVLRFRPSGDAVGVVTEDTAGLLSNVGIRPGMLSTLHLTAQSASTRDIIASTLRSFRAQRLASNEAHESARRAEATYFGNVVDKASLRLPAVLTSKTDSDSLGSNDDVPGDLDVKTPGIKTIATTDEVFELKRQLASQSLVIKATQNERNLMAIAVEVRDRKLDDQVAVNTALQLQVESLRGELKVANAAIERSKRMEESALRLQQSCADLKRTNEALESQLAVVRTHNHEMEAKWAALDEDCRTVRAELAAQQALCMNLVEERNNLKSKATDLSKELRRLLKHGQSVGDVEAQLFERMQLQIDLAEAKADVKRYQDEMNEFKNALDCHVKQRGMGDVEMQRVLSQNKELQRLVTHFSTALSASQEEVAKWKTFYDNSPLKGMMATQIHLTKSTSFKRNEQLVFDEDDEESDDEAEGKSSNE